MKREKINTYSRNKKISEEKNKTKCWHGFMNKGNIYFSFWHSVFPNNCVITTCYLYNQKKHLILFISKILVKCQLLPSGLAIASQCFASLLYTLEQKHIAAVAQYLTLRRCPQNNWSFPYSHRNFSSSSHFSKERSSLPVGEAGIWTQITVSVFNLKTPDAERG